MANNNETVEQVCGEFKTSSHTCKNCDFEVCPSIIVFADRIIAAHNREINAIAAQKTAEAHEAFVKNAELAEAIAAKDAEIVKLRALVGELAECLYGNPCTGCGMYRCSFCKHRRRMNALVAKAREVVK